MHVRSIGNSHINPGDSRGNTAADCRELASNIVLNRFEQDTPANLVRIMADRNTTIEAARAKLAVTAAEYGLTRRVSKSAISKKRQPGCGAQRNKIAKTDLRVVLPHWASLGRFKICQQLHIVEHRLKSLPQAASFLSLPISKESLH